jgi:hypothetical protein
MRTPGCREVLAVLAAGVMLSAGRAQDHDEAWVRQQVDALRRSDVTGWARIPWVASLTEARRVSGAERAPVFLFTHAGNLETGRC